MAFLDSLRPGVNRAAQSVGSFARSAPAGLARIKAAFSPAKVTARTPLTRERPLYEQFQRIGGGLSPAEVSAIIRQADAGQPARMIDLGNESRQKDGHMQCVLGIREGSVALLPFNFSAPKDASSREKKAAELCKRAVEEFDNWPELVKHLTGSAFPGHATSEIEWETTSDGFVLPKRAKPIHAREFIFSLSDGKLRYSRYEGDPEGVDLLAENPGRIVQIQRRINGDVQVREGLIRVFIWAALFRNWSLRDWLALGETAWKPWRLASYDPAKTTPEQENDLLDLLERIGSQGAGVYPNNIEVKVQWPQGSSPGMGGSSSHQALLEWVGREMSKAALGQTTSTEPGMNGDRAATETRDKIRTEVREDDAISVAAVLRSQVFAPLVRLNFGERVRVPVGMFDTSNAANMLEFSQGVAQLAKARVRMPSKWVREEIGCPEPLEGEEVIGLPDALPEDPNGDDENSPTNGPGGPGNGGAAKPGAKPGKPAAKPAKAA